jgi:hypothetical protein
MKYPGLMAVVFVASIFVADAQAQTQDDNLKIMLESPYANTQIGQIGEIRGWATHPTEEVIVIYMYVDGEYFTEVPVGGQRADVQNAYPDYVNSLYSGWSQTTNFKSLTAGYHDLEIVAYTEFGTYNSLTIGFCVDKFTGEFISDASTIDFRTVDVVHKAQNALLLEGVEVDGEFYNMELHWSTAQQGFVVEQTRAYEEIINDDYSAYSQICEPAQ